MNEEQPARCATLAKRIAELDPDWARPGMIAGRFIRVKGDRWVFVGRTPAEVDYDSFYQRELDDAIAAGPDYTDQATLGAILLSLGDFAVTIIHSVVGYSATADLGWNRWCGGPTCATRAEAILAAKVAQLGQEATHAG